MRLKASQVEQTYKLLQHEAKGHPGQLLQTRDDDLRIVPLKVAAVRERVCVYLSECIRSYLSGGFYSLGCAPARN